MATSPVIASSWADGITSELGSQQLAWLHGDIPAFVAMARISPDYSILVLNCGTGVILEEVFRARSTFGGAVGIDGIRALS